MFDTMTGEDFGVILGFFSLYFVVAMFIIPQISETIKVEGEVTRINSTDNSYLQRKFSSYAGVFFGLMWPITVIFFLSLFFGKNIIYEELIYNGNEEDRIASWFI